MYQNEELCFSRKAISLSACGIALILLLLFNIINEYTYVNYSKELRPIIKNAIPVSCIPLEENNGKIIHINCPLQDVETFYAPPEFSSNLYSFQGVFFETKVEMFQWVRDYANLGLFPRGRFVDHVVPTPYNFLFFLKRRKNPTHMPLIGNIGRKYANHVKAGNYKLPKNALVHFQKKKKLDLIDDGHFTESEIKPPFRINHLNTRIFNNYLYTGDPFNPQIGDVRISFYGNAATHATVIGVQKSRFMNTMFEIEGINVLDQNVTLLSEDNKTMSAQIKDYIHRNYGNITSLWLLRIFLCFLLAVHVFVFLSNDTRNMCWKIAISSLVSVTTLSIFPCMFWFFCDTAVFLSLFIFIIFMLVALAFLYNTDMEDGYMEMKNYMKRTGADASNYTFLNIPENHENIYDEEYNFQRNHTTNVIESNSELSFIQSINNNSRMHPESSPVYFYHDK